MTNEELINKWAYTNIPIIEKLDSTNQLIFYTLLEQMIYDVKNNNIQLHYSDKYYIFLTDEIETFLNSLNLI